MTVNIRHTELLFLCFVWEAMYRNKPWGWEIVRFRHEVKFWMFFLPLVSQIHLFEYPMHTLGCKSGKNTKKMRKKKRCLAFNLINTSNDEEWEQFVIWPLIPTPHPPLFHFQHWHQNCYATSNGIMEKQCFNSILNILS